MPNRQISIQKFKISIMAFSSLVIFYILFPSSKSLSNQSLEQLIFILSWIGIFELIYIFQTWRNITKRYISLYTLFITFFFLFNFGQSLLWAFGIHIKGEIGSTNLYYVLRVPENIHIVQTQLIVLISGIMIHFGAVIFKKRVTEDSKLNLPEIISNTSNRQKLYFKFAKILAPVVMFSEFYTLFVNYRNAQLFGYTALYYNPDVVGVNVIFKIISRLFFPVLVSLLIGSGYSKKTVKYIYIVFAANIGLSVLIGDRGGWFYGFLILIICHHYYYKKIRPKQFVIISSLIVLISYVSSAIVVVRNSGVSVEKILSALSSFEINPLINSILSIGKTMGVTTTLVMNGWDIFPYGNTFFYGFLIAPSKNIIDLLKLDYVPVGGWFSQEYLGISNGAGFSIVAETLINYGPYLLPIFMILFGVFIYWITDIENKNPNKNTFRIIFSIITTAVTINISRNTFNYNMGEIIYTTVQFFVYFTVFKTLFINKHYKTGTNSSIKYELKNNCKYEGDH